MNKRMNLCVCVIFVIGMSFLSCIPMQGQESYKPHHVRKYLDEEQKAAFMHFWKYTTPSTGMIHASTHIQSKNVTTGGSGFGVMTVLVGIERGWISRREGALRILETVHFLEKADRIKGAWSHWMTHRGKPVKFGKQVEAGDIVETSFMMMGLFAAEVYLDRNDPLEKEIRTKINDFRHSIRWNEYVNNNQLFWAWDRTKKHPKDQYILPLRGYNEALITYILALGAPAKHAVSPAAYQQGWKKGGKLFQKDRHFLGYPMQMGANYGGPMFLSHYTFLGVNPKQVQDEMVDYQAHGIYHTMINRHYCLEEAPKIYGYDECNWGLTACSGPKGKGYKARKPGNDDGVIAPTAAISSIIYTPYYALQVMSNLHRNRPSLQTSTGFGDAYSLVDNWDCDGCIAIDQGPIVVMIENYRSGLLWKLLSQVDDIQKGVKLANMKQPQHPTGFPYAIVDVRTGYYDMVRHPDREVYELDYFVHKPSQIKIQVVEEDSQEVILTKQLRQDAGAHLYSFSMPREGMEGKYKVLLWENNQLKATSQVYLH